MPKVVKAAKSVPASQTNGAGTPPVNTQDQTPPSDPVVASDKSKGQEPEEVVEGRPVRFMRNAGPVTQIITFADGTPYAFPSHTEKVLDSAKDAEVIEQIRAVANKVGIYEDVNFAK